MTAMKTCPKCHSTEHLRIEITDDHSSASRSVKVGGQKFKVLDKCGLFQN